MERGLEGGEDRRGGENGVPPLLSFGKGVHELRRRHRQEQEGPALGKDILAGGNQGWQVTLQEGG